MDIDNSIINTANIAQLHNKICEHTASARKSVQQGIIEQAASARFSKNLGRSHYDF